MKKRTFLWSLALTSLSYTLSGCQTKQSDEVVNRMMEGISNQKGQERNRYLTPGDKTYIVGTQDGNFPDLGSHVQGEMGGVWNHLIKLMDGFWLRMSDNGKDFVWLENAERYITYPYGSEFIYPAIYGGIEVKRLQFCPQGKNGVVVTYVLENNSGTDKELCLEFVAKTDLSPVWSSERIGLQNGEDKVEWDDVCQVFKAIDTMNSWNAVWGATEKAENHRLDVPTYVSTAGSGKSASSNYKLSLENGKTAEVSFVIAGSKNSMDEALASYDDIIQNKERLLNEKKAYYADVITRGKISIPDKKLEEVYNWVKVNTEWLVADLEGVGRFLGAGAVEYQWLFGCDNSYSLQGVVASGNHALAEQTLTVIKNMSEKANGNGRILHEMAFNAFVSHPGNTQETAHFIMAVWNVFNWTGNQAFLTDMYPYMKKGIDFLLKDMDQNGNMFPEGYGIMEVSGLDAELIDVSVYTQQALEAMAAISALMNENTLSAEYASKALTLKNRVNNLFWDEEIGTYCDFYGSREQALSVAEGAIHHVKQGWDEKNVNNTRAERIATYEAIRDGISKYPEGTNKGWLTNRNWVISTPVETGIAPKDKALKQLDFVRNENCGEYGPYLAAVEKMHMMTISTGVQAMAECAYGRVDEAMWYINRITDTFGCVLPGSIAEMMPDYGCPTQAWTVYGVVTPLIRYIYGIQPEAQNQLVTFSPNLPKDWNRIAIEALPIGNGAIDYKVEKVADGLKVTLDTKQKDWKYQFKTSRLPVKEFILNGKSVNIDYVE